MKTATKMATTQTDSGATTGHEAELWAMADALRGSMDAAEYKHVVLGLIFLKYISDAFEEHHAAVLAEWGEEAAEDRDEYVAENIFWVPQEARWAHLKGQARQPTIGQTVDRAMAAIERDNPALKEVLPKDYARPALDKQRLGQLIDMIGNIRIGDAEARSRDVLGRVYEYFLSQFAGAEGKKGGEFYTPRCVVKLLVEMLEPYRGRVYDPCCGSSGMFVQSIEFIRAHASGNGNGGKARGDISIYGQESNYTTWRLAKMNLAIRGIGGQIAHGDSFHNDRHPDLKADFILANPAVQRFGLGRREAGRRQALAPWHPAEGERELRLGAAHGPSPRTEGHSGIRAGQRVDVVESVRRGRDPEEPDRGGAGRLHGRAAGPALLLDPDSRLPVVPGARAPIVSGEILFIDARKLGRMVDRTHRELTDEDIARIADIYHAWRTGEEDGYADIPGFCKSTALEEVRRHGHVLTPGRYVGVEPQKDDGEPFDDKMKRLVAELREQQDEGARLDAAIAENLKALEFGGPGP